MQLYTVSGTLATDILLTRSSAVAETARVTILNSTLLKIIAAEGWIKNKNKIK